MLIEDEKSNDILKKMVVERFEKIGGCWGYSKKGKDAISFSVSSPILISGCGIMNQIENGDLQGTINLFKGNEKSNINALFTGNV